MTPPKDAEREHCEAVARDALGMSRHPSIKVAGGLLADLIQRERAAARDAALEEAAATCDGVISDFRAGVISGAAWTGRVAAGRIRALKKESGR